ncbi:lipopolysaccharide assembly protein LapB [Marinicella sp. S1101]|uniref:lipopolysaccharide assembly protein LapB n=1 Tax=Marinicella marina TaxID=2996016 RepID=UPI0022608830|nr:lipopolysaccharide assembly protein LapB [Marinicella marina]MCX7553510.1 lipopolysaccharide assembly protein LapB [Marinicella marina]MDJ1140134.1 lipopolysaccharide assembly protein LapB [Marinicella marina]
MSSHFLWTSVALLAGILMGLYLAIILKTGKTKRTFQQLNHRYFKGLNYLLNDESDKAIDVFIQLAETSQETFEPQLALGNLYRRKGEVDRAIKLHQALIAQAELPERYRTRALLAIGKDYMSAGLLDRAEVLFSELVEIEAHTPEALHSLVEIYQQEQDWLQAIKSASRFQSATNRNMQVPIGHFYCELAELSLQQEDIEQAEKYLSSALRVDERAVRSHLICAKIKQQNKQWQAAIDEYHAAKQADPAFIPLFIEDMVECYLALKKGDELEAELLRWIEHYQGVSPVLALAQFYSVEKGEAFATEFLTEQLNNRASFKGLNALIELNEADLSQLGDDFAYFNVLKDLIDKLLKNKPKLRCRKCGFGAKSLHWQCPSCKNWGVVKPIYGLESE